MTREMQLRRLDRLIKKHQDALAASFAALSELHMERGALLYAIDEASGETSDGEA